MSAAVGIRALKQNASSVVADAAAGATITITARGRPVAQLTPIPTSRLRALVAGGNARPALHDITLLAAPAAGPNLSVELAAMRDDERF
jgi:prevent-host-death family protein